MVDSAELNDKERKKLNDNHKALAILFNEMTEWSVEVGLADVVFLMMNLINTLSNLTSVMVPAWAFQLLV